MIDPLKKIIEKVLSERDDIPFTFAVDGDLAKQAEEAAKRGDMDLAESLWRTALEKEYGVFYPYSSGRIRDIERRIERIRNFIKMHTYDVEYNDDLLSDEFKKG